MKYFIANSTHPFILYFEKLRLLVPMAVIKLKEEAAFQVVISFLVLFNVKRALNYCHGGKSLPAFIHNHTPFCTTLSLRLIKSAASSHIQSHTFLKNTWRYLQKFDSPFRNLVMNLQMHKT